MFESVSFIGAGRIARIMLGGWKQASAMPAVVLASDANPAAIAALQAEFPEVKAVSLDEAAGADLVFGALHPPAMPEMRWRSSGCGGWGLAASMGADPIAVCADRKGCFSSALAYDRPRRAPIAQLDRARDF